MLETDHLQDTANLPQGIDTPEPSLTRQQLEEIRDEWLRPLLMQLRHQSEEVGRLEMQVRQLRDDRERLTLQRDELNRKLAEHPEPPAILASAPDTSLLSRDTLARLMAQLPTAEGAVVTGIALAIGLWLGVGMLAFVLLG